MREPSRLLRKVCLVSLLAFACGSVSVAAQVRVLVVESNQAEALVYADSTFLGRAASSPFQIDGSTERISVVPPSIDTWSIPTVTKQLMPMDADTVNVLAQFKYYYRLESVPSGATVYMEMDGERRSLGITPLDYASERPLEHELVFDLGGHLARSIEPDGYLWNRYLVLLEVIPAYDRSQSDLSVKQQKSARWIDYAAAGTAIVGGILAVHYKTKADHRFDRYNETRNPSFKSEVKRLDVYSGVALGAMQVGLGVLAFRMVF